MRKAYEHGTINNFMDAIFDMKQCQSDQNESLYVNESGTELIELISIDHNIYTWSHKYVTKGKSLSNAGYHLIHTRNGAKLVHRLVADAWLLDSDNYNEPFEVDHIDGNKENNHRLNLRLVSHSENMKYAWDKGLIRKPNEHARYYKSIETLIFPDKTRMHLTPAEYVAWRLDRKMPIKGWMRDYMYVAYGIDQF